MQAKSFSMYLGLLAGFTVMASTVPDFISAMSVNEPASASKIARDAAACAGNVLWVIYGTIERKLPIQIFCSLAAIMLAALVVWQL